MSEKVDIRNAVAGRDLNIVVVPVTFVSFGLGVLFWKVFGILSFGMVIVLIFVILILLRGNPRAQFVYGVTFTLGCGGGIGGGLLMDAAENLPVEGVAAEDVPVEGAPAEDIPVEDVPVKVCVGGLSLDIRILERKDGVSRFWDQKRVRHIRAPDPRGTVWVGELEEKLWQREDRFHLKSIPFFRGHDVELDQKLTITLVDDDQFDQHDVIVEGQEFDLKDLFGDDYVMSENGQMEIRAKCLVEM